MPPTCSIVIICWNNQEEVNQLLKTILSENKPNTHITLVNNAKAAIPANENYTIVNLSENLGFSGAANAGIMDAFAKNHQAIMLLNSDIKVEAQTLKQFIQNTLESENIKIAGPIIEEREQLFAGGFDIALNLNTRKATAGENQAPMVAEYVPGTAILVKKEVFEKIGFLDEDYFFSGEIADFCKRAHKQGIASYILPNYTVKHDVESKDNSVRNGLYVYYNFRNRFLFINKHYASEKKQLYRKWTKIILRQIFGALATANFSKARALRLALNHGKKGIFGNQNHLFFKA